MPHTRRSFSNPKVLVTGGAGFIGMHLVRRLVEIGCRVAVIDNLKTGRAAHLAGCLDEITLLEQDIRERQPLARIMNGFQVVYHLAAQSNVIGSSMDVSYSMSTNVVGTANVVHAARSAGVRRMIFTSSREVYGEPDELPVSENAPLRPKNAYGRSKVAGEMCCAMAACRGFETSVVRIANAYGMGDRDRVIPRFIESALSGAPLTIYGGKQVLDFVPVDYVVEALVRIGLGTYVPGPVNIGSGQGTTIRELAERILALANSRSRLRVVRTRAIEVSRFIADTAAAERLLGLGLQRSSLEDLPALVAAWRLRENKVAAMSSSLV